MTTLTSFSFPSGHSTGIAAAAGVVIVLARCWCGAAACGGCCTSSPSWSRCSSGWTGSSSGVHNPSDVLAGCAVGAFWVFVGLAVYDPAPRAKARRRSARRCPTTQQLAVVLNPIKVEDAERVPGDGRARAPPRPAGTRRPGTRPRVEDPGRSMAEAAAVSGAELVIVCGGDGTVRTVCAELAGTGVSVGVVPAGTGNLLARNLGIPLYLQAAVDVALQRPGPGDRPGQGLRRRDRRRTSTSW